MHVFIIWEVNFIIHLLILCSMEYLTFSILRVVKLIIKLTGTEHWNNENVMLWLER
jgi:hypothetical protein